MKLHHYYHIYAQGNWFPALSEHVLALKESGLIDEINVLKIGVVGDLEYRNLVYKFLDTKKIDYDIRIESDKGWEQLTQTCLYDDAQINDGYFLYAHTKGAANPHKQDIKEIDAWRKTMCYYNVMKWKDCIKSLNENDICGIYWMEMPNQPEHVNHKWFFAGTYWWATSDYLREIDPPPANNRYSAEGWIGLANREIKVRDFAPGWDDARKNNTNFPPMQDAYLI